MQVHRYIKLYEEERSMREKVETYDQKKNRAKIYSLHHLSQLISADNTDRKTAIFMRDPKKLKNSIAILKDFTEMVEKGRTGTGCVRESRMTGLISFTIKRSKNVVKHYRFAYIKDKWVDVSDKTHEEIADILSTMPYFKAISRRNINESLDKLFELLITEYKLDIRKLLWPNTRQASVNCAYSGYAPSKFLQIHSEHIYANPLEKLEVINNIIIDRLSSKKDASAKSVMHTDALKYLPNKMSYAELLKHFQRWVIVNKLDDDLLCPIGLVFFVNPCVLSSGRVVEKETMHKINSMQCPLTRVKLTGEPKRLRGWNRALNDCLLSFIEMIKHEKKASLKNTSEIKSAQKWMRHSAKSIFSLAPKLKKEKGPKEGRLHLQHSR